MGELLESLPAWTQALVGIGLLLGSAAAGAYAAYQGATRQASKAMEPLVGAPPYDSANPFTQRLAEFLQRLNLVDERQVQGAREVAMVREDVRRNTEDLAIHAEQIRAIHGRLGRVEENEAATSRRATNVERALHLHVRADSAPAESEGRAG